MGAVTLDLCTKVSIPKAGLSFDIAQLGALSSALTAGTYKLVLQWNTDAQDLLPANNAFSKIDDGGDFFSNSVRLRAQEAL